MKRIFYWIIGIIVLVIVIGTVLIILDRSKDNSEKQNSGIKTGETDSADPFDTTCGGIYDLIPNGLTDKNGKYALKVDNDNGTILIKDSVTSNPVPNIDLRFMVACDSLDLSDKKAQQRTLSEISFQIIDNEKYNTDVGTVSFTSDTGLVTEVTVLVISKTATVPDAESAIQIAQADDKVKTWISGLKESSSPIADVRDGKWRVYFQGTKECLATSGSVNSDNGESTSSSYGSAGGDCSVGVFTVHIDSKTGKVTKYEQNE